jgi:radical SAM protein with 4Fe4S-binding SPASM domain
MEDKFMMDSHKLMWHLDRVNEWSKDKRIAPVHIDFGITTGCNLACKYCYGVIQGRTNVANRFDMPKESILRFLKDAKESGVKSIAFAGEGENTLNPALYDALEYAKSINIDVSLATNGIAIKEEKIKNLLETLVWLRINISASNPESYKKMHCMPEQTFDKVISNVTKLVEIKKKNNLSATIGLQMVVLEDNFQDIVPLAKLGRKLGVDYLVVKPCSDTSDNQLNSPHDKYLEIKDILKEAEDESTEDYTVSIKWSKISNKGIKDYKVCYGTQFILGISATGNVFPCGHFFIIEKEKYLMGNIIETSFKDILNSERYWEVQDKIKKVNVNKDCESNCRQHYINGFLYKLKNKPAHVNFI